MRQIEIQGSAVRGTRERERKEKATGEHAIHVSDHPDVKPTYVQTPPCTQSPS